jgi:hypothetical protein
MTYRVGQKVVCIKRGAWETINGPDIGDVVTVSRIYDGTAITLLKLEELTEDICFNAICFRPVQETEMQTLRSLLKTKETTT